jgi:hypothetical protein
MFPRDELTDAGKALQDEAEGYLIPKANPGKFMKAWKSASARDAGSNAAEIATVKPTALSMIPTA